MTINPKWSHSRDNIFRRLLWWLGYRVEYVCAWGTYDYRYDAIDWHCCRPIHQDMSIAPPWAKRKIVHMRGA